MEIYTFWEPREKISYYLQLCMETWKKFLPNAKVHVLDYKNIREYVDIDVYGKNLFSGKFSLPQISDAIRALVLMQHGGVWLDVDTIFLHNWAKRYFQPTEGIQVKFFGNPTYKTVHIAAIQAQKKSDCMESWVEYCKEKIANFQQPKKDFWAYLGNSFMNPYVREHGNEIRIYDAEPHKPETLFTPTDMKTEDAYRDFYFYRSITKDDMNTDMLILHNSWTPAWFKPMGREELLECDCTMANILLDVLEIHRQGTRRISYASYEQREIKKQKPSIPKNKEPSEGIKKNVDYNYVYPLWRILSEFHPKRILEFNLDASTQMVAQYASEHGAVHTVLEHNRERVEQTVKGWSTPWDNTSICGSALLRVKLQENSGETEGVAYQNFDSVTEKNTYDLILLKCPLMDGIHIHMDLLKNPKEILEKDFFIVMDHAESAAGRKVVSSLLDILKSNKIPVIVKSYRTSYRTVILLATKDLGDIDVE